MSYTRKANLIYAFGMNVLNLDGVITKEPYISNSKWYMCIRLDNDSKNKVIDFESKFEKRENMFLQQTVTDNIIVLKLPYRYKRFECSVFDKDGDPLTCYELKEGQSVTVKSEHACFSVQTENILSTWKVKEIIVHEDSRIIT